MFTQSAYVSVVVSKKSSSSDSSWLVAFGLDGKVLSWHSIVLHSLSLKCEEAKNNKDRNEVENNVLASIEKKE